MSEEKLTNKQRKTKVSKLIEILNNETDSKKVVKALDELQEIGDDSIIEPLFDYLLNNTEEESTFEVIEFLSSLKSTSATEVVIGLLNNKKYQPILSQLLSTIWNSPLNYSNHISFFVELAVKNDFEVALECLTIIENMEGPFEEEYILDSQIWLKDYLEGKFDKNEQKNYMISEIALSIKNIDRTAY